MMLTCKELACPLLSLHKHFDLNKKIKGRQGNNGRSLAVLSTSSKRLTLSTGGREGSSACAASGRQVADRLVTQQRRADGQGDWMSGKSPIAKRD